MLDCFVWKTLTNWQTRYFVWWAWFKSWVSGNMLAWKELWIQMTSSSISVLSLGSLVEQWKATPYISLPSDIKNYSRFLVLNLWRLAYRIRYGYGNFCMKNCWWHSLYEKRLFVDFVTVRLFSFSIVRLDFWLISRVEKAATCLAVRLSIELRSSTSALLRPRSPSIAELELLAVIFVVKELIVTLLGIGYLR